MYSFKCDYGEGAHPRILRALQRTNLEQTEGYLLDPYTQKASGLIKERIGRQEVDIHLLMGGTQTNLVALSAFLRPHQAVICADSGHIFVHETGAIEATGHKVFALLSPDGKLTPAQVKQAVELHTDEHMVKPKVVFLSNPTEVGTIYTKKELAAMRGVCDEYGLFLYIDGARLGCALTCRENDMTLRDFAAFPDAFYIGGTKNGAFMGEALVIANDRLKEDFRYLMKQKGALMAKGRFLGIQFCELFSDDLYFSLARHANDTAAVIRSALKENGYSLMTDSPTNQLFPIFPKEVLTRLEDKYLFTPWKELSDGRAAVRIVTSWATPMEQVQKFAQDLEKANKK